jgi:hypothetical protein
MRPAALAAAAPFDHHPLADDVALDVAFVLERGHDADAPVVEHLRDAAARLGSGNGQ